MTDISWAGGISQDHAALEDLHNRYLVANSKFDWDALRTIWSDQPDATFFNMNGHTYNGSEQWIRLWKYYKEHIKTGDWFPYDIQGAVSQDLAVIWCHRKTRLDAKTDSSSAKAWQHLGQDFPSRSTMVFRREPVGWRVVHVHFSEGSVKERPGGI